MTKFMQQLEILVNSPSNLCQMLCLENFLCTIKFMNIFVSYECVSMFELHNIHDPEHVSIPFLAYLRIDNGN